MGKYIETIKVQFKTQLAFRFDVFTSIIFTVSKILLASVLWGNVFGHQTIVAGFTLNAMLSYYIISSFLTQLDQSTTTGLQISLDIKNGTYSKYMVRPINTFGYFSASTVGVSLFLLLFNLAAAALWVFLFRIDFVMTKDVVLILWALLLIILGLIFMMQLNFFIGILAFKYQDTSLFMMIKDSIVQFVTGSLIPLVLLPTAVIKVMSFFPFYYISYLPAMLFLGRNQGEAVMGVIMLGVWNIILAVLNWCTYNRLKNKYEGVGI